MRELIEDVQIMVALTLTAIVIKLVPRAHPTSGVAIAALRDVALALA